MEAAKRVDTGALAETASDLKDIPDYLERLRVLDEEALPEKLSRFLEYLNRSSDQGVTQLVSGIAEEVDAIENRIAELNQTDSLFHPLLIRRRSLWRNQQLEEVVQALPTLAEHVERQGASRRFLHHGDAKPPAASERAATPGTT